MNSKILGMIWREKMSIIYQGKDKSKDNLMIVKNGINLDRSYHT